MRLFTARASVNDAAVRLAQDRVVVAHSARAATAAEADRRSLTADSATSRPASRRATGRRCPAARAARDFGRTAWMRTSRRWRGSSTTISMRLSRSIN
jgi:hypothetical protein